MSWPQTAHRFFGRRDIGAMTDDGHHGEGEHDQRHVTVPAMPGAGFVVIEAEFGLGGFETVLDGPAMSFDRYQLLHGRVLGTPCGKESEITVGNVAADQQTPRPLSGEGAVVFAGIELGQLTLGPDMQPKHAAPISKRKCNNATVMRVARLFYKEIQKAFAAHHAPSDCPSK